MRHVVSDAVREEALRWCDRLALDRAQDAWSIRFTHDVIAASPATRLAWQEYCAVRARRKRDTPPRVLWAEAAEQLRADRPRPRPKCAPPPPPSPPLPRPPKKKKILVAKKQSRRTISVSQVMYKHAKDFADAHAIPLAQLTERALAHAIARFKARDLK